MRSGGCAGSGRSLRLDPFGLPVRFLATDAAADGQVRQIELHRKRLVVRRSLRGMRMALNMPLTAFDGISLQLLAADPGSDPALAVVLEHSDPSLALPLFLTSRPDEALAEWCAWGELLDVPLLLSRDGMRGANARFGQIRIERPRPRRRRRSVLKKRRPSILLRRFQGRMQEPATVHRGEREIIARN
ncbi:MAG TPA: DUF6101 family protein [Pseudolabrys sp.]|nr:DUF6101 family protein [Pseudolabrys sp.]